MNPIEVNKIRRKLTNAQTISPADGHNLSYEYSATLKETEINVICAALRLYNESPENFIKTSYTVAKRLLDIIQSAMHRELQKRLKEYGDNEKTLFKFISVTFGGKSVYIKGETSIVVFANIPDITLERSDGASLSTIVDLQNIVAEVVTAKYQSGLDVDGNQVEVF